jgi:hypothetical protein
MTTTRRGRLLQRLVGRRSPTPATTLMLRASFSPLSTGVALCSPQLRVDCVGLPEVQVLSQYRDTPRRNSGDRSHLIAKELI